MLCLKCMYYLNSAYVVSRLTLNLFPLFILSEQFKILLDTWLDYWYIFGDKINKNTSRIFKTKY